MENDKEKVFDQIRGIFGEHMHSWCFACVTEDGDVYADATNAFIGEALFKRAGRDYECSFEEDFDWIDDDDDEGEEWEQGQL